MDQKLSLVFFWAVGLLFFTGCAAVVGGARSSSQEQIKQDSDERSIKRPTDRGVVQPMAAMRYVESTETIRYSIAYVSPDPNKDYK